MIFRISAGLAVLAISACGTTVPDSNPNAGGGVGFGDYERYEAQREARDAQLEARLTPPVSEETMIAQETLGVLNATVATAPIADSAPTTLQEPLQVASTQQTLAGDRERLAEQRQTLEIAQPEAVPDRPTGRAAPNIVSYALATNNPVGRPVYSRSSRYNEERYRQSCAEFGSSDQAQAAFLAAGGPERDRRGLDPDGDGFACFWDPSPFRTARGG